MEGRELTRTEGATKLRGKVPRVRRCVSWKAVPLISLQTCWRNGAQDSVKHSIR